MAASATSTPSANNIASEVLPRVVASSLVKRSTLCPLGMEAKYPSNCCVLSKSTLDAHQPSPPSPPLSTICQATSTTLTCWQFEYDNQLLYLGSGYSSWGYHYPGGDHETTLSHDIWRGMRRVPTSSQMVILQSPSAGNHCHATNVFIDRQS